MRAMHDSAPVIDGGPRCCLKAYFVRRSENREVVGIFVAPSLVGLAAIVDECCDPGGCDYAETGAGGLMVAGETGFRWPMPASSPTIGLHNAVASQQWENDLSGPDSGLEWRSLQPAALRMLRSFAPKPDGGA